MNESSTTPDIDAGSRPKKVRDQAGGSSLHSRPRVEVRYKPCIDLTDHDDSSSPSGDVFLGLGSNLGDREAMIMQACERLNAHPQITVIEISDRFETVAVGPTPQPDFINAVARIRTTLAPRHLLNAMLRIEADMGRVRTHRWGPRLIDLDILIYDDLLIDEPGLVIPHPHMHARRFVLDPLATIAPDLVHPAMGQRIADLRANCEVAS